MSTAAQRLFSAVLLTAVLLPAVASAQMPGQVDCGRLLSAQPRQIVLSHENDFMGRTDRNYTSGVMLAIGYDHFERYAANPCLAGWFRGFSEWINRWPSAQLDHRRLVFSMGQQIYTPTDYRPSTVISNDRPYAGWLFGRWDLSAFGERSSHTLALDLGMVGPAAAGQASQNFFHKLEGYPQFQGWSNQLRNELGVQLTAQWRHTLWTGGGGSMTQQPAAPASKATTTGTIATATATAAEPMVSGAAGYRTALIGHYGLALGNVETYANAGLQWRYGRGAENFSRGLPVSMRAGNPIIVPLPPKGESGAVWFVAADVRAVAWNIFLDGNTRTTSHSVTRRPVVADISAGVAWRWGWADLIYTHTFRTREFEGQTFNHVFGALSIGTTLP